MIESYFDLLGLREDATSDEVEATRAAKEREHDGVLPGALSKAFSVLAHDGFRSIYRDVLELSRSMEVVERPDVQSARAFAESHHFKVQVVAEPNQIQYVNVGLAGVPGGGTTAKQPSVIEIIDEGAPKGGPNKDYFELLGVDSSIGPAWKLQKAINDAILELKDAYGSVLPRDFEPVIRCLFDGDSRESYIQLLRWADSGETVDYVRPDLAEAGAKAAEGMHFDVIRVSESKLVFRNLGLPDPPLPGSIESTPEPQPQSPQALQEQRRVTGVPAEPRSHRQEPRCPQGKDQYGRVNGKIPPIYIGDHAYNISFVNDVYLQSIISIDRGLLLNWVLQVGGRNEPFSIKDHNAHHWAPGFLEHGKRYAFVKFEDLETGEKTTEAYIGTNTELSAPLVTSVGLWGYFPWPAKYLAHRQYWDKASLLWSDEFPGRFVPPPNYFGRQPWDDDTYRALAKYLVELVFWTRAAFSGFTIPVEELRPWAKKDAASMLSMLLGMKPKQIRKLGLPSPAI